MKRKISYIIVILAILFAVLLQYLLDSCLRHLSYWAEFQVIVWWVSAFSIYILLWKWVDWFLWKKKFFRKIFSIDRVDLSGKWKGKICSSYSWANEKSTKEIDVVINISQSLTTMSIHTSTHQSKSSSIIADVVSFNGIWHVYYVYVNKPGYGRDTWMNMHSGYSELVYDAPEQVLDGNYSTFIERGNTGTIKLQRQ